MPERRAKRATRGRIVVALIVPMVAVAAALAAAGIASGSTAGSTTQNPRDGGQPPVVGTTTGGGGGGTTTGRPTATGTRTGSPTGSPTRPPTATPTPTGTGQTSPGAPGVPPGGTGARCPAATGTATGTASPTGTATGTASPTGTATGTASPTGTATGTAPGTARPAQGTTVAVGQAGGKSNVLVDQNGCALYLNINDTSTSSACDTTCESTFPPALGPGQAGTGVNAQNLSTFTRESGRSQVTYFGHQLYYFSRDTAPGQANGQGQNQTWYLVGQNGEPVRN